MTALLSTLGAGVSDKKVLEFLMRKSPELAPNISSALASGLSAEKIVKWFSKSQNFEKLKSSMEDEYPMGANANPLVQAQNVRGQNLGQDPASALQRNLPGIAAGVGAAAAAPYVSKGAQYVLSRALPQSVTGVGSQSPADTSQAIQNIVNPNVSSSAPTQGMPLTSQIKNTSFQPPVASNIPQEPQVVQPQGN